MLEGKLYTNTVDSIISFLGNIIPKV